MEATAIQSVEKNITMVALANVQPSNYNPRKNFDETSLAELSESIRQQGVLQPIGVRPIEDNRFEIVFGERQIPCLPHGRIGRNSGYRYGNFRRGSRRNG